ncbi:MAG: hypothetical protein D6711_02120 [Chloroflexi bacterium]|nr:MAG: hypothetical protein D6711_02120 [Chloroflexota bacterium]
MGFVFSVTGSFFLELWDILLYLIFPTRFSDVDNLATLIIYPNLFDWSDIFDWAIVVVFFLMIPMLAFLVAKIVELIGDANLCGDSATWRWVLMGFIVGLGEPIHEIKPQLGSLLLFTLLVTFYWGCFHKWPPKHLTKN